MPEDNEPIERDWERLGRESPLQRSVRRTKEGGVSLFGTFILGLVRLWEGLWKPFLSSNFRELLIVLACIAGALYVGYNVFRADGRIDYCRVEMVNSEDYKLEGHRPWREDKVLMEGKLRADILRAAKEEYHCEIH